MARHFIVLMFCMLSAAALGAPEAPPPAAVPDASSETPSENTASAGDKGTAPAPQPDRPEKQLETAIHDMLAVLAAEEILAPENGHPSVSHTLEALAEAVGHGVEYIPGDTARTAASEIDVTAESDPAEVLNARGVVGYCRVPSFTPKNAPTVEGFLENAAAGHYEGIVLDLRHAGGDAFASAAAAGQRLSELDLPVVILVNGNTVGASELFADYALGLERVLIMGRPTRGIPCRRKQIRLTAGDALLVPDRSTPGFRGPWPPVPLEPDLEASAAMSAAELAEASGEPLENSRLTKDRTLRQAIDLLTAVQGLGKQHF